MTDHQIHHAPILEAVMPRSRRPETRGMIQFTIPPRRQHRGSEDRLSVVRRLTIKPHAVMLDCTQVPQKGKENETHPIFGSRIECSFDLPRWLWRKVVGKNGNEDDDPWRHDNDNAGNDREADG
jgi:hypothetical protein